MDIRMFFSEEYLALSINYLEFFLSTMPLISMVVRRKEGEIIQCIREYSTNTKYIRHEYRLQSDKGRSLYNLKKKRDDFKQKLDDYKALWFQKTARPIPRISMEKINTIAYSTKNYADMDFYNKLESQAAVKKYGKINHPHTHKKIPMRTKLEMLVASTLDRLDLNYKYEPSLLLGDYEKFTDFFVSIPILNVCFPTEVAGKMEDRGYLNKMMGDLVKYFDSGYVLDKNFLLITETEGFPVNTETLAETICVFINKMTHEIISNAEILI